MKTIEFKIQGMHCAACELFVENSLMSDARVEKADAKLKNKTVAITLKDENVNQEELKSDLNKLITEGGYKLVEEESNLSLNLNETIFAFVLSAFIFAIFIAIQKLGIANTVSSDSENYSFAFIFSIGVIASLSTCMAVVGGLVLSLSAKYSEGQKTLPLILFHISRVVGFFLLGGVIGLIGSAFVIGVNTTFVLNLILFLVMAILGISLTGLFPTIDKFQVRSPKVLGKKILELESVNSKALPVFLGTLTFFLPCGFTQSMQVYSLTTGSFFEGAVTMLVFALGTLPVLSLISFASVKLSKGLQSKLFYKTAGFLIIFFALINLHGALVIKGIIEPLFTI